MLYIKVQNGIERIIKALSPETIHSEDNIDRDVIKTGSAKSVNSLYCPLGVVSATHKAQAVVVKRLYAHRDSVYRCLGKGCCVTIGNIVRIDLNGNLLDSTAIKQLSGVFDKTLKFRGVKQRWRTSAKVYCSDSSVCQKTVLLVQLAVHSLNNIWE